MTDLSISMRATAPRARTTRETYVERWEQVLRVLRELPGQERFRLDMATYGVQTSQGIAACAGGLCSLDDWFRQRGFTSELESRGIPDTLYVYLTGMSTNVFFGIRGAQVIFHGSLTDYDEVLAAVNDHIQYLKAGGDPDDITGTADDNPDEELDEAHEEYEEEVYS